ncbi:MAG: LicD family protein [Lachnospiraceae bacterium]|jgi:lipopolysaccharide cholinephosphotransferase|nr:LicD family protein [Lachnospiraceae bacterium]
MTRNNSSISITEQKTIMLEILKAVDLFCNERGLKYFLAYGTLLGAVRHKGFIPWDDDIDLIMLREDYEEFLCEFNRNRKDALMAVSYRNVKGYYMSQAKVIDRRTSLYEKVKRPIELGVFIDIFPIDKMPNDYETAVRFIEKAKFYRNLLLIKNISVTKETRLRKKAGRLDPILYRIAQGLLFPCSRKWLIEKQAEYAQRYRSLEKTDYYGSVEACVYGKKEILHKADISQTTDVLFEGEYFKAPAGYHNILKGLYGDYMTPPKKEDQVAPHGGYVFWKKYYKEGNLR